MISKYQLASWLSATTIWIVAWIAVDQESTATNVAWDWERTETPAQFDPPLDPDDPEDPDVDVDVDVDVEVEVVVVEWAEVEEVDVIEAGAWVVTGAGAWVVIGAGAWVVNGAGAGADGEGVEDVENPKAGPVFWTDEG